MDIGPTITTVILTKDQTGMIEPLLRQAADAGHSVIVLDDFSDDILELNKLAARYHALVLQHTLEGDYAQHRNWALSHISTDWTLFLDADELPEPGFWEELDSYIQASNTDALFITRQNQFLGRTLRFGEAGRTFLLRAARTSLGKGKWRRAVHEVWDVSSEKTKVLKAHVLHRQPSSTAAFLEKLNRYSLLETAIRPPLSHVSFCVQLALFPIGKFLWNFVIRQGFRDGFPGFALAFFMSYYSAIERIQLYEKSK